MKYGELFSKLMDDKGEAYLDLSSSKLEDIRSQIDKLPFKTYEVTAGTESAIDLICFELYGNYKYWWFILNANDVIDPISELSIGRKLKYFQASDIDLILNDIKEQERESSKDRIVELP